MKENWKMIRIMSGLTQQDVANVFKVRRQYISKIENFKTPIPAKYREYYLSMRGHNQLIGYNLYKERFMA